MLEPALTLCQAMKADVTLLRVVTPAYPMPVPAEPAIFGAVAGDIVERVEKMQADLTQEATAYLDKVAARIRAAGMTVHTKGRHRGPTRRRDPRERQGADRYGRARNAWPQRQSLGCCSAASPTR